MTQRGEATEGSGKSDTSAYGVETEDRRHAPPRSNVPDSTHGDGSPCSELCRHQDGS